MSVPSTERIQKWVAEKYEHIYCDSDADVRVLLEGRDNEWKYLNLRSFAQWVLAEFNDEYDYTPDDGVPLSDDDLELVTEALTWYAKHPPAFLGTSRLNQVSELARRLST